MIFHNSLILERILQNAHEGTIMNNRADTVKTLRICICVATFLKITKRHLQAIELCWECLVLLNNTALGIIDHLTYKLCKRHIYLVMFNACTDISDCTNAERCARKLISMLHDSGETMSEGIVRCILAKIYCRQRKFEQAKRLFEIAIENMKAIGERKWEVIGYNALGHMSFSLQEYQKAKEYYEKALAISMEIGDKEGEATEYQILGILFEKLGGYQKAEEFFKKAVAIATEIGDKKGEATNYKNLGDVYALLGEYQKATEYYEKALVINMEIGDKKGEAVGYGSLGSVLALLGEYQKAKEFFEKAVAIATEIGDKEGEATNYRYLGGVYKLLGECQKATEYYEKALIINMEIGDKKGEAECYGSLGNVFLFLGEHQKAKECYEKAVAIDTEIGYEGGEPTYYENLGNLLCAFGEYHKAKEYLEKALALSMKIGDKRGVVKSYGGLGDVFASLGEYYKAKEYYEKALAINMEIGDKEEEVKIYACLGTVFKFLGKFVNAKEYFEKAHPNTMAIGYKKGEARIYESLGHVFLVLNEYQKAKEYYEKALAINMEIGDKEEEVKIYACLGTVFKFLGKFVNAKEYFEKAHPNTMAIGYKKGEARIYESLGHVFLVLNEYQKAKDYFEKALTISIETGDKLEQAYCYLHIGRAFTFLRKYRNAKEYAEEGLSIATEIGDRESQVIAFGILGCVFEWFHDLKKSEEYYKKQLDISSVIGNRRAVAASYKDLGEVCLRTGEYDRAYEYLERARVISFDIADIHTEVLTLLQLSILRLLQSKAQEAFSYVHQCIAKYETLRNFQQGNEQFQLALLEQLGTFPYEWLSYLLCSVGNPRDAIYVEELRRARCLAELIAQNFSVENHISADPKSWRGMEEIVSKERSSAFLYISYYDRRVSLWVLKANGDILFRQCEKVDNKTLMDEKVSDLNHFFKLSLHRFGILPQQKCEDRSLSETIPMSLHDENEADLRGEDTKETERRLSVCFKVIIAPVADLLTESEIIIVPERSLYRVPFAALRDKPGGKCLAETFRIRIVPSLTTLKLIQDCPVDYHSQTGALVVGDPKVGRAHYRGEIHNFTSLTGARKEAEMIGQLLGVQPLLGERATREAVLQAINSVSLIHIAAHGNPDRGEIALSPRPCSSNIPEEEDYLLRISDISKVKLRAKLVVLSCCHSGRGEIKVEGVIGIARAFLASGARSVLVTLWAIEDEATEQFMRRFYKHLVDGLSASECLHQAMKWLRDIGFTKVSQWAPFMLIGDNVTFDFTKQRLVLFHLE